MKLNCVSCNRNILEFESYTRFNCPNCNEFEIVRCERCKKLSNEYICEKCKFVGP